MEPTGEKEPNAGVAIIATYTTACLLDDANGQPDLPVSLESHWRSMRLRLIASASGLLRRGNKKSK